MPQATGSFTVKMTPQDEPDGADGTTLGRLLLEKTFAGALQGAGKGTMLTALTATEGSAVYVAIERFTGSLNGRTGSFVFKHVGIMDRGAQDLSITVVPDSASGELVGLAGTFGVAISNGQHSYTFDYTLPADS